MIRLSARIESNIAFVLRKVQYATAQNLAKAGALIRAVARASILKKNRKAKRRKKRGGAVTARSSRNASKPGTPPHTRRGRLRNAIVFDVENGNVVIGPTANLMDASAEPHEYGGMYKGEMYPARPFMGPALERVRDRLPSFWKDSIR